MSADDRELDAICAHINGVLDVAAFIPLLDYYPERAQKAQGMWRMLCPVHCEQIFRTLVINPRRNTYQCDHGRCPAHHPGNLVELLQTVRRTSRIEAVMHLIENFGPERLRLNPRQLGLVENLAGRRCRLPGAEGDPEASESSPDPDPEATRRIEH